MANPRNAGRKSIINPVKVTAVITKDYLDLFKNFIKTIQKKNPTTK